MSKELWIALLTFAAGVITLATEMLPIPQNVAPYLLFAVGVINLAMAVFFGVTGVRARNAANQIKQGH